MKRPSRENQLLILGIIFSVALHVGVVMPWLSEAASASENRGIIDLATAIEQPPPEPEEPSLGLEDSMAKTMNWIGYEEYEEHLARLAETDQAAFQLNQSGGGGTPPTNPSQSQQQPRPKTADQSGATAPPSVAEPPQPAPNGATVPNAEKPTQADRVEKTAPKKPDPDGKKDAEEGKSGELTGPPAPEENKEPTEKPEPKPKPQPQPEPQPEPQPSPNPKPDPGEGPGSGGDEPGEPGDAADREADPTSIIDVPPEKWRTGKPLAAHGLELQTMRPQLTPLTLLSARYGNPVAEIRFARNGRPVEAFILTSSGDQRVDGPILDSLYRWRAKGEQLKELKGEETVNIRLRIVLR